MRFFKKEKKNVPGLNTSSTADISFMLLIFFLVTTSMDSNKGIYRSLPPMQKKQHQEKITAVNANHVMQIQVKKDGVVKVDSKSVNIISLRQLVLNFIKYNGAQHVIQLKTERDATYDEYFQVQNAILFAYNTIRDKKGLSQFGRVYALCDRDEQKVIDEQVPIRISEVYVLNDVAMAKR